MWIAELYSIFVSSCCRGQSTHKYSQSCSARRAARGPRGARRLLGEAAQRGACERRPPNRPSRARQPPRPAIGGSGVATPPSLRLPNKYILYLWNWPIWFIWASTIQTEINILNLDIEHWQIAKVIDKNDTANDVTHMTFVFRNNANPGDVMFMPNNEWLSNKIVEQGLTTREFWPSEATLVYMSN